MPATRFKENMGQQKKSAGGSTALNLPSRVSLCYLNLETKNKHLGVEYWSNSRHEGCFFCYAGITAFQQGPVCFFSSESSSDIAHFSLLCDQNPWERKSRHWWHKLCCCAARVEQVALTREQEQRKSLKTPSVAVTWKYTLHTRVQNSVIQRRPAFGHACCG
jgi:hypothetical protein